MLIKLKNLFKSKDLLLFLYSIYSFEIFNQKKKSRFKNTSIVKLNSFMTKFYKQSEIAIDKDNYIIPFRFYSANDYVLNGIQYISDFKSKKWIISLHDFGQNKYWSLYFAKPFMELGYNVLTFDFTNHGDNKRKKTITLGQLETLDLEAALKWLVENKHPETIGLMGVGLGAYTINNLYFEKSHELVKSNVKFAIAESTYNSVESLIMSYYGRKIKLSSSNRSKKIARAVKRIFSAAWRESRVNLEENNLITKFTKNQKEILKNYIPFFYTNFDLNDVTNVKDSLELIALRDKFPEHLNKDKAVIYNFSKTNFVFRDHFKNNLREIIEFEEKIMKNKKAAKKAIIKLKVSPQMIEKSNQEYNELVPFKIDK